MAKPAKPKILRISLEDLEKVNAHAENVENANRELRAMLIDALQELISLGSTTKLVDDLRKVLGQ